LASIYPTSCARSAANTGRRAESGSIVVGFVAGAFLGAVLYMRIGFWSVLPFTLAILYLASLAFRKQFI
jgi:uncharacterized membrane protein YoaK (UPF0700 family)